MKKVIIALLLLVALAGAAGQYTDWQSGAVQGLKIGFHMGQAYQLASEGINVSGYNADVDKFNTWVRQNFGEDPNLIMNYYNSADSAASPARPVILNNTTSTPGIVHKIDGSFLPDRKVTTNDMNLLSDAQTQQMQKEGSKGEFLGGV